MNAKPVIIGIAAGIVTFSVASMMMPHKKKCCKHAIAKTLRDMGDMADSICSAMGW